MSGTNFDENLFDVPIIPLDIWLPRRKFNSSLVSNQKFTRLNAHSLECLPDNRTKADLNPDQKRGFTHHG